MGKIRHERQKYHLTRTRSQSRPRHEPENSPGVSSSGIAMASPPLAFASSGVFDKVAIDTDTIVRKLPELDRCSVVSATDRSLASQQGPRLTKKQKLKLRHATFIEKINAIQNARKNEKDRRKRQSTAITGDMRPLTDALPSPAAKESHKSSSVEVLAKPVKKFKARQKQMLQDIEVFRQVLSHPSFQSNPEVTIMEHLRNKMYQELN